VVNPLPPARSWERIVSRERKYDTGRVDALRCARDVLHQNVPVNRLRVLGSAGWGSYLDNYDQAPDGEHTPFSEDVQEQLGHGQG
jgi:hypothetical protein